MTKRPAAHTHLDRQRRERGLCPGCDADWDAQTARLSNGVTTATVIRQQERMAHRPPPTPPGKFCAAHSHTILTHSRNMHVCGKLAGHDLPHFCPLCEEDW